MKERIKRHIAEKKYHYKVALIGVILFAIFFFAHTVGDADYQEKMLGSDVEEQIEIKEKLSNVSQALNDKTETPETYG